MKATQVTVPCNGVSVSSMSMPYSLLDLPYLVHQSGVLQLGLKSPY